MKERKGIASVDFGVPLKAALARDAAKKGLGLSSYIRMIVLEHYGTTADAFDEAMRRIDATLQAALPKKRQHKVQK